MTIGTLAITNPDTLTIVNANQVYNLSIKAKGGSVNVTGSGSLQGIASTPITLVDGASISFATQVPSPIDLCIIEPASGATAELTYQSL